MTRHKLKRVYERAGFRVCFPIEETSNFPVIVRDLDGNKITDSDPRWSKIIKIHKQNS